MLSKDDTYRKIFANNLNYYMQINGKIQDDLVRDLSLKSSTISSWCNGQKLPRMDKILLLAKYFGIHFSKLIEEKTDDNYFEFIAKDDAMYPLLDIGDIALVYKQNTIDKANSATRIAGTYLIQINNQHTIRRFLESQDKTSYTLDATNVACKPMNIKKTDLSNTLTILGRVVEIKNKSALK